MAVVGDPRQGHSMGRDDNGNGSHQNTYYFIIIE